MVCAARRLVTPSPSVAGIQKNRLVSPVLLPRRSRPHVRAQRADTQASGRAGSLLLAIALALLVGLAATTSPAGAQGVDDEFRAGPDFIWDLQTPDPAPTHTANLRALVYDLEEHNGRVYAAGKFLEARSPQGTVVSRPYVAAFDVATGALDPGFAPVLDAPAYSLDVAPNGQLVVGGEFTGGMVLLNPVTGARNTSFNPNFDNTWGRPSVWDLEVVGNSIFAGGSFNRVGGTVRANLAKVSVPNGALDSAWAPTAVGIDDGTRGSGDSWVMGIAVDTARARVYVAGRFDSINSLDGTDNFVVLDPTNGQLVPGLPQSDPVFAYNHDDCAPDDPGCWQIDNWYYDVQFEGNRVYLGGQAHTTIRMDANLSVLDGIFTNRGLGDVSSGGDTQVIFVGANTVWSGCHCWGSVGWYDRLDSEMFGGEYREVVTEFATIDNQSARGLVGVDKTTGQLTPQVFDLTGQSGAWAILEDSYGRLWSGGQYLSGGGRTLNGLARFTPAGGLAPLAPASCTASVVNGNVRINWVRSSNDLASKFVVRRNRNAGSLFWAGQAAAPATSWVDTRAAAGASYGYTVETVSGNDRSGRTTCTPNPIVVTNGGTAPVAPANCSAAVVNGNVRVSWTRAAGDNATAFVIRRARNGGTFWWAGRTNAPATTWTDTNAAVGASYGYTVETLAGSQRSTAVTCTPNPIVVSGAGAVRPANCSVSIVNGNIRVTWTRAAGDAGTSMVVRRSRNGGAFFWANRTNAPATTWTDTNVAAGSDYRYTVESRLGNTSSATRTCTPNPITP